ncbi:peptidyl-prolyl cis-trans isomerase [Oceanibaculum nanhaiense]|uniref:peptidyl-prolyl cis-trans isomerase n=1 Tax=Oceanibaculum nanhaiense TaxID=1909734 RepID=UPI003F7001F2
MLQSIRTKTASWVVKILFALLVLSFAVWGVEDMFRGGNTSNIVITVEDVEIPAQQVSERLQSEIATLRQRFGQTITTEQARQLGLLDTVIDSMANDAVFLAFARDRGIAVTDEMVREAIAGEPAFRGPDGSFSRDQFVAALRSVGMTEEGYVQTMRRELMRQNVINATLASASAPDVLVDRLYRHRNEKRVADLIFLANSAMQDVAQPTEAELAEFHKSNERRYLAPEYRSVSFVTLTAQSLAAETLIPDEELRREYEARAAGYATPETRDLSQMLFSDEEKAKQAATALAGGQDFAAVAQELAGMGPGDLTLAGVSKGDLVGGLGDAVFALPEGGVSEPLNSPFGWHLFRVDAIKPATTRSFEEVREQLRAEMAQESALDQLFEMANRLEDGLASGATLEETAQSLNAPLRKLENITRTGQTADGTALTDLPAPERFLEAAFQTTRGEQSNTIEGQDGSFTVLRVDSVTEPAVKPFDSVRDQVKEDVLAERRAEAAKQKAEALADQVKGGTAIADAAGSAGLSSATTAPFTRDGQGLENLPRSLASAAFRLDTGAVQVVGAQDGQYVMVLKEIRPADPAQAEEGALDQLRQSLSQGMGNDLYASLTAGLRQSYPVKIDQAVIDRFF